MASTEDMSPDSSGVSILLIGDHGSHKTFFAGSCPSPFIFNLDGTMTVLAGRKGIEYETIRDAAFKRPGRTGFEFIQDKGLYKTGTAWDRFIAKHNEIGQLLEKGTCPYKTLVWDSLSSLTVMGMMAILNSKGHLGEAPTLPEYNILQEVMISHIAQFAAWPLIKVVTAHIERMTDELVGKTVYLPFAPYGNKWRSMIPTYFNEIYYTKVVKDGDQQKFTLITRKDDLYTIAKSPYGVPDGTEATWDAVSKYYPQPYGNRKAA